MTMKRPQIMGHDGRWRYRLLRAWQEWRGAFISVGTETHEWTLELPSWPWRWVCWIQGHQLYGYSGHDRYCIVCCKSFDRQDVDDA